MKLYFILPILFAFSCKANSNDKGVNDVFKIATASGASAGKDPEVVMGGPTNVKITVVDFPSNGTAKFFGFYSDQNFLADSIVFQNGVIEYKNEKGLPQGMYYVGINGRQQYIQVVLGKDQEFEMTLSLSDILSTMQVNGSDENKLFYDNMRYETTLSPKLNELNTKLKALQPASSEYIAIKSQRDAIDNERLTTIKNLHKQYPDLLFTNYKLSGQNPKLREDLPQDQQVTQYRKEFWTNVNFSDTRLLRTPMIANKLKRYMKELTVQSSDSIVSSAKYLINQTLNSPEYFKVFANWVVLTYEPGKSPVMDSENIFVSMVQNYFTKERAFWSSELEVNTIQQRATEMSASLLGKKGPNVVSTDQFGKKQDIYSKTADYIVVYMYNPDCEHCQEQSPKLVKYYNENKTNVDVFAIAIDTDDAKWKAYIQKTGMAFTNVYDPTNRSIYGKYFVDVTPEIYVLNKERIIIGKNLKVDQIQTVIDRDKSGK
jgi:thiol-disulfide isomerase/thioredoxin